MRKLDKEAILETYLNALAHVYDPHSDYMGHEQMESFGSVMNLSVVGIGASLQSDDGYCKIREIVPGGPAARSGELKEIERASCGGRVNVDVTDVVDKPLQQAEAMFGGRSGMSGRHTTFDAAV